MPYERHLRSIFKILPKLRNIAKARGLECRVKTGKILVRSGGSDGEHCLHNFIEPKVPPDRSINAQKHYDTEEYGRKRNRASRLGSSTNKQVWPQAKSEPSSSTQTVINNVENIPSPSTSDLGSQTETTGRDKDLENDGKATPGSRSRGKVAGRSNKKAIRIRSKPALATIYEGGPEEGELS